MINLVYYAILIPLLVNPPSKIHKIPYHQHLHQHHQHQFRNFAPYYHHCIHKNAAVPDVHHFLPRYPSSCWMNYTSPFLIHQKAKNQIILPYRTTMQFPALHTSHYPSLYQYHTSTSNVRKFY